MRIAVTYENGGVFAHFGHTAFFKIYDVEDGKTVREAVTPTMGYGHGALAEFLKLLQVDVLLCGGIGQGAMNALAEQNIAVTAGVSGEADVAVQRYLAGQLVSSGANCSHHGAGHSCSHHEEGHSCSHHGKKE